MNIYIILNFKYSTENFDTKLKSASQFLPKQKNYVFYSKEPKPFKNLVSLNKEKRKTLDINGDENLVKMTNDYLASYERSNGLLNMQKFKSKMKKRFIKLSEEKENTTNFGFLKGFYHIKNKSER